MSRYRRLMQKARRRASAKAAAPPLQYPRPIPGGVDAGPVDEEWQIDAVAEVPMRCLLCGGREAVRLFFSPDNQRRACAPEGRTRMFRYSLCLACYGQPDALRRAGDYILTRMDAANRVN